MFRSPAASQSLAALQSLVASQSPAASQSLWLFKLMVLISGLVLFGSLPQHHLLLRTALCATMVAQRLSLFDAIHRNDEEDAFITLAFSSHGSRLLQDRIEVVSATTLLQWQRVCLEHALILAKHRNGTFVVSKLIQESPPWFSSALCVAFVGHVADLARNRRGSRILERIMEHHGSGQVEFFFAELVLHSARIVADKYGNYVIQHVFEIGPRYWRRLCMDVIIKTAERTGSAGCYMRCALASAYERSNDFYMLRMLIPLRAEFLKPESSIKTIASDRSSE